MTGVQKILGFEALFVEKLLRFGLVGFILGYSLTIVLIAFVLWNALIACTSAGLFSIWRGTGLAFNARDWSIVLVFSLFYATAQWIKQRTIKSIKR